MFNFLIAISVVRLLRYVVQTNYLKIYLADYNKKKLKP